MFSKARPVPIRLKDKVLKELNRLEKSGVISRVISSDYASPVVCVLKADSTVRICADLSKSLNLYLERADFPLPSMDEITAKVNNAKFFSKIDLKSAYAQIPLTPESRKYTVISTSEGLYNFNYLPYGSSCSPAIFQ